MFPVVIASGFVRRSRRRSVFLTGRLFRRPVGLLLVGFDHLSEIIIEVLLANQRRQAIMVKLLLNVVDYTGEQKRHALFLEYLVDLLDGVGPGEVDVRDGCRIKDEPVDLWFRTLDEFEYFLTEANCICIVKARAEKVHDQARCGFVAWFNGHHFPAAGWQGHHQGVEWFVAVTEMVDEGQHYRKDDALLNAYNDHYDGRDRGHDELHPAQVEDPSHALDVDQAYRDQ